MENIENINNKPYVCNADGSYLKPEFAKKDINYICKFCSSEVILCKGEKVKPYWRHKLIKHEHDIQNGNSCYHNYCVELLKRILESSKSIIFDEICGLCLKNMDSKKYHCVGYKFIKEYFLINHNGRADMCVLNEQDSIEFIVEVLNLHKTKPNKRPEPWFEISCEKIQEKYNRGKYNYINFIDERKDKLCVKCKIGNNHVGKIIINQRGAGSGKTFENVQIPDKGVSDINIIKNLIEDSDYQQITKIIDMNIIKNYIFCTKLHSAKDVTKEELDTQNSNGYFNNIKYQHFEKINKSYEYKFIKNENLIINIFICTIDSLIYNLSEPINEGNYYNIFEQMCEKIKNGHACISNNSFKILKKELVLHETLVIVDEAQDLPFCYFEALASIKNLNLVFTGDKLQSLFNAKNIFSEISEKKDIYKSRIYFTNPSNICKRFHKETSMHLVNKIVKFEKFHLPEISSICDGKSCDSKRIHDYEKDEPFTNNDYIQELEKNDIISTFKDIEKKMDNLIFRYNYLPKDFLFIFPIVNIFKVSQVKNLLSNYWENKFQDSNYVNNVLMKDCYWKVELFKYNIVSKDLNYVFLHKSEEGRPIDLNESINATRISSIHASKGTGRNVVFLIHPSEQDIRKFSKEDELMYESFVYVCMTRHKHHLFVYLDLELFADELHNRFRSIIPEYKKKYINFSGTYSLKRITKFLYDNHLSDFKKDYTICNISKENVIYENIDMTHHNLRTVVFKVFAILYILEELNIIKDDNQQLFYYFKSISNKKIEFLNVYDYFEKLKRLREFQNYDDYENSNDTIYLIKNSDIKLNENIKKSIQCIQKKIKLDFLGKKIIPNFCPFECFIIIHLLELENFKPLTDIRDIFNLYKNMNEEIDDFHLHTYKCVCNNYKYDSIIKKSKISYFYEEIKKIKLLVKKLVIKLPKDNYKINPTKCIYFKTPNIFNYGIKNYFDIILYGVVNNFIIKLCPQFNEFNIEQLYFDSYFEKFLLLNSTFKDVVQIKKNTNIYILSFDNNEPTSITFNNFSEKKINMYFKKYMDDLFTEKIKELKEVISCNDELLVEKLNEFKDSIKVPLFIRDSFETIHKSIDSYSKKELLFLLEQELYDNLKSALKKTFGL